MSTQLQDVRRLEAEFADAMTRMYAVGNSLARLRASLEHAGRDVSDQSTTGAATAMAVPSAPAVPARHTAPSAPPAEAHQAPAPAAPAAPAPPASPAAPSWWQREGAVTRALAVAGAVVTLVGIAMLLALAMQQGWFGPELRVALGVLLAVGLVGAAHVVRSRERAVARSSAAPVALAATGYAAGSLDVVASTAVYGWVPDGVGMLIGGLVAVTGLFLARTWGSQLLAVLTVGGATLLAPTVVGGVGDEVALFVVVLSGAALLAGGDRGWPVLALVRTVPASALVLLGVTHRLLLGSPSLVAVAAAAGLSLLAVVGAVRAGRAHPRATVGSVTVAAATCALVGALGVHGDALRSSGFGIMAAAFAVALYVTSRPPLGPAPTPLAATFGAISGVTAVLAVGGATSLRWSTVMALVAVAYAAAAITTKSRVTLWVAAALAACAGVLYLQHPADYASITAARWHPATVALVDSALVGGLAALLAWGVDVVRGIPRQVRRATRVVALVAGLLSSAVGVISLGIIAGRVRDGAATGFVAGHAVATVVWMIAAAWLLTRGLRGGAHRSLALRLGLGIAAVSVAKLFLFDLATLDGLWRVAAFIVTGLLLLASGTAYAKALERTRPTRHA